MKHKKIIPILGLAALASGVFLYDNSVKAEDVVFKLTVTETPEISIAVANSADLAITPNFATPGFDSASLDITVGSRSANGYTLLMVASDTALTSENGDTIAALPSYTGSNGGYTCTTETRSDCDFTVNSWGYKVDDEAYYKGVSKLSEIASSNAPTDQETTTVTFAGRVNSSQPGGEYTATINFSAVGNPVPYIQDIAETPDLCTTVASTVYDKRDGEAYTIQRLADGRCWLLDDLRLDPTNPATKANITAENTNASAETLRYFKNGGGADGSKYARSGVSSTWSDSYTAPIVYMEAKDSIFDRNNTNDWKAGGYYNYCAVSAGSYCYDRDTNVDTSYGFDTEDICPKGWRMPTSNFGGYGELGEAITEMNDPSVTFRNALRLPLSGVYKDGRLRMPGVDGYFWTTNRDSTARTFTLYVNEIAYNTSNRDLDREVALPVRCVMRDPLTDNDIILLQGFNSLTSEQKTTVLNSMPTYDGTNESAAYTVIDSRDNTKYHIAKLADGRVWLLDNLALDLTKATVQTKLTSATTNASDTALNYLKNGGRANGEQYPTSGVSKNWTGSYSYSDPLIDVASKDATSVTLNKSDPLASTVPAVANWKYGVYYNYCAASAGSYCYGNGTSYGTPPEGVNATEDICPAGWRMPTGGDDGEYQALAKSIILAANPSAAYTGGDFTNTTDDNANYYNTFRTIFHAPLSGFFYNGSVSYQGLHGFFWSSTRHGSASSGMHYLNVDTTTVGPQRGNSRRNGYSVRCMLKS